MATHAKKCNKTKKENTYFYQLVFINFWALCKVKYNILEVIYMQVVIRKYNWRKIINIKLKITFILK
jgi:hypothetical protein